MFYKISYCGAIYSGILILDGFAIFPNGSKVSSEMIDIIKESSPIGDKYNY